MNLTINLKLNTEEKESLSKGIQVLISKGIARDEVKEGEPSPLDLFLEQLGEETITLSQDFWDILSITFFANSLNPNNNAIPKDLFLEMSELIGNLLVEAGYDLE